MKEQFGYRVWKTLLQKLSSPRKATQLNKLSEIDWDILVVLDACRADVLEQVVDWPTTTAVSPAGCTAEWLGKVAASGVFEGAHVVSGNPQYERVDVNLGCKTVEPYWEEEWDKSLQTVLPEPVLDRATEVFDTGDSPVVAHLEQPHWPYIAKLGGSWELAYPETGPWTPDGTSEEVVSFQVAMQRGYIDRKQAYSAYRASVASVWSTLVRYIQRWYTASGTVVVTADHGETFGRLRDLKLYEHPCFCHVSPLATVPFVEFRPRMTSAGQTDSVQERLQALGYAN
jgi:hypothetical protein